MPRHFFAVSMYACLALAGCGGGGSGNGNGSEASTTSNATLTPSGAPPMAHPALVSVPEDGQYRAVLRAVDADGDALTFSIADPPAYATVTLDPASGAFELRPHENFHGTDAFEYAVADGYGNVSRARIDVTVEPVNDAPLIDTTATATVVAAGRSAQLAIAVADVDGDRITKSVSQTGGSSPLSNLEWGSQGVRFVSPSVRSATTADLLLRVTDESGLASETTLSVTLSPISRSGKLFTVVGHPQSNGLHWVITGDGFTADQQQDLLQEALAMARKLVDAPELASHSSVWNVHVLTAVSRNSGIAANRLTRGSRTAFNASLNCSDIERVACVDWNLVHAALLSERAPFDELAVILNTDLYVGSSSSSGMLTSRHRDAPAVVLHEMGHQLAQLGDEYVDAAVARESRKFYQEGRFPNVTTATDPALIPWRHWFADAQRIPVDPDETGIGRFEGAYYMPIGFYRPKSDSFMRSLHAPIGEVNAEAWVRALYRALPPLLGVLPAHRAVTGLPGEALEFKIVSEWPANIMAVRWHIDGVEVESARDTWRYVLQADGLTHEVRVSIEDRTGLIRNPDVREHKGGATWTVSGDDPSTRTAKASPERRIAGWIRMRVDSTGHAVMGMSDAEARTLRRPGMAADSGFEYALFDSGGTLLSRQRIDDPRVVRGPLPPPGMATTGHGIATLESGYYLIGIPEGADARKVRIRAMTGIEKTEAESMTQDPPTEQWLDL
jgi:hypothetical protein